MSEDHGRPDAASPGKTWPALRLRGLALGALALAAIVLAAIAAPWLGVVAGLLALFAFDRFVLGPATGLAGEILPPALAGSGGFPALGRALRERLAAGEEIRRDSARLCSELEQLRQHAFHDPLTGLPNRELLNDRLAHALARFRRPGAPGFALLLCALDWRLEERGDWNLARRDALRLAAGQRLAAVLRPGDTLATWADPVFAVLVDNLATPSGALRCAERLRAALVDPAADAADGMGDGMADVPRVWFALAHAGPGHAGPVALLQDAARTLEHAIADDEKILVHDPDRPLPPPSWDEFSSRLREILEVLEPDAETPAANPAPEPVAADARATR